MGFVVRRAQNIDQRAMSRVLAAFYAEIQPGDRALFFYSGHGFEISGANYLLPIDVPAARPGDLFDDVPEPDIIVFPGGVGTRALEHDDEVLEWVRRAHVTTRLTTSVCTGSLVLGAAGLLDGLTATTHWSCYPELEAHGARPVANRVVEHLEERLITAAGVSSGIDMALRIVELVVDRTAAQAAQLMIEYDPQPPFDCGSLAKADDAILSRVIDYAQLRQ